METHTEHHARHSDTYEEYLADDAWAGEGGNIKAGDPAPPPAQQRLTNDGRPHAR
jgi:hypothetical protein